MHSHEVKFMELYLTSAIYFYLFFKDLERFIPFFMDCGCQHSQADCGCQEIEGGLDNLVDGFFNLKNARVNIFTIFSCCLSQLMKLREKINLFRGKFCFLLGQQLEKIIENAQVKKHNLKIILRKFLLKNF